jgi:hypothetical protein
MFSRSRRGMKSRQDAVRGSVLPKEELKRCAEFPDGRIIMLTTFDGDVEVQRALEPVLVAISSKACLPMN